MKRTTILLLGLGMVVLAVAGRPMMDERALMDSLRTMPPKVRLEWLHHRGIELPGYAGGPTSDSGLKLVSKWGRGPAAEVTGKDTLVVLTLGSEVALLSFANPDSPRVLSEIQFPSLTAQSCLVDTLLYTSSNADLEIWNVADPTQPVKRGELLGSVGDFWIRDTFLFYIRRDTLHSVSIANPANLYELGSAPEAGSATTGSGNTVVIVQSGGFAFVDVSNPASPHEVGFYPCGFALSATARGNLVCASFEETSDPYPVRFITLDITDPANPRQLARLNDLGGNDIYLDSSLAFVSGRGPGVENPQPFQILSIADSVHPTLIDSCRTTAGRYPWGVWASLSLHRALVADEYDGLAIVDISNLNNAVLDTNVVVAASAEDVSVDGQYCYVADGMAGLHVLDVADPSVLREVGALDTAWEGTESFSVAVQDSFAFLCWSNPYLRVVDVTNPANPVMAGGCQAVEGWPKAMVLRDSFLYMALNYQFEVINVARPREPVVVGTCGLPERSDELLLDDTLAYVANLTSLQVLAVANPSSPRIAGSWDGYAYGIDIQDTVLYLVAGRRALTALSIANPAAPHFLDSVPLGNYMFDVLVVDTIAYCGGWDLRTVSVADPRNLRLLGERWVPPSLSIRRLLYEPPYIYACCTDGGLCILETLQTGLSELTNPVSPLRLLLEPTVTAGRVRFRLDRAMAWCGSVYVHDVGGTKMPAPIFTGRDNRSGEIDLSSAPDGVYLLRFETDKGSYSAKVVKTTRR